MMETIKMFGSFLSLYFLYRATNINHKEIHEILNNKTSKQE